MRVTNALKVSEISWIIEISSEPLRFVRHTSERMSGRVKEFTCAPLYSGATCCIPRFHAFMHSCETFATGNNLIAVDARKRAAFWWFLHAKPLPGKLSKEVSQ